MNRSNYFLKPILASCAAAFFCPRGGFYPNKEYGSKIKQNIACAQNNELLCYARQAVSGIDGVFVCSAAQNDGTVIFTVMINDEKQEVSVNYE